MSYIQGYLSLDPERVVRVPRAGDLAGTTRSECEYPIPLSDAEALMKLCLRPLIEKVRYVVEHLLSSIMASVGRWMNSGRKRRVGPGGDRAHPRG
jgi:CYTH domain-containing protein